MSIKDPATFIVIPKRSIKGKHRYYNSKNTKGFQSGIIYDPLITLQNSLTVLDEANFLGVAVKTLSAAHKAILPDQSMGVPTHTAAKQDQGNQ